MGIGNVHRARRPPRRWPLPALGALALAVGATGAQATGGALDPSFGTGGKVLTDLGYSDGARAVAVQQDGKIVVAGYSFVRRGVGDDDFALVRYLPGGRLDGSFGTKGKVLTDLRTKSYDAASAVAVQRDGKIVIVGDSEANLTSGGRDFALVRYLPGGKLDTGFGSGGKVLTDLGRKSDDLAVAVALQADGTIVVAGITRARGEDFDFALVRYTANGRLDTSFGTGGKALTDLGTESGDNASAVAVQADGKVVVAGSSRAKGENSDFALVRYTTDGMLDRSFGTGGKVLTGLGAGRDDTAQAVAIQRDGRIVTAGTSSASDRISDVALVRHLK